MKRTTLRAVARRIPGAVAFGRKILPPEPTKPPPVALAPQIKLRIEIQTALLSRIDPVQPFDSDVAKFAPCEVMQVDGAKGTVFAFGGMANRFAIPTREFFGVLQDAGVNVVFVKDFLQVWYQKGLLGLSSTRDETAEVLRDRFADLPRPWITTGSSAGGFAALWFAAALQADRAVAFGPQTKIHPIVWQRYSPFVTPRRDFDFKDPDNDLRDVLANRPGPTDFQIHYAIGHIWDKQHAIYMARTGGVTLRRYKGKRHGIARQLRENGTLVPTILGRQPS